MKRSLEKPLAALVLVAALALVFYIATYEAQPQDSVPTAESSVGEAEPASEAAVGLRLATWNLFNFGGSKDAEEIAFIARQLRDYDLVAVQEVSTGPAGAQAVARLADELSRTGTAWDYAVSDPTTGSGSERYAYLWKPSRVRLVGRPWLEPTLADPIDREPFLARFETRGKRLLVASFHAVPTAKNPASEVALLNALDRRYEPDNLVILGDFNLAQDDEAFDSLKALGFAPVLEGQRTSLRRRRTEDGHLASEYDNIFYETAPLRAARAGAVDFTGTFPTLKEARTISDHLPVYMHVQWN